MKILRLIIASLAFIAAGSVVLFVLNPSDQQKVSTTVLLATGIVIAWYTYETYLIREDAQINTEQSKKPVVVFNERKGAGFKAVIQNIGRGAAINIELRIAQFSKEKNGYCNLRNLLHDVNQNFYSLASGGELELMMDSSVVVAYMSGGSEEFKGGVPGRFALIINYHDVDDHAYCTVIKCSTVTKGQGFYIKNTKVSDYSKGELPVFPRHLIEA